MLLDKDQILAVNKLKNGSVLCGGVGSGKSRTALTYYFVKVCNGELEINGQGSYKPMREPKDLYIITTAKKRDTLDWEKECIPFLLSTKNYISGSKSNVTVDSWNNIQKYTNVCNAFFIFDEQRVVGSGVWVKSFLQIAKKNLWILLSATPGDTWLDYIPVFIANGFYKNRSEFLRRHVIYSRYSKYPKVEKYMEVQRLINLKKSILVDIHYVKKTERHEETIIVDYDRELYRDILRKRRDPVTGKPFKNIAELCSNERKLINTHPSRIEALKQLLKEHPRSIVFYNFDYELDILRAVGKELDLTTAEWNGHKHQPLPEKESSWLYILQYTAGSEAWNCTSTDTMIFYSQNYSYKIMEQSKGRIDRRNTSYQDLYYYTLRCNAPIDIAIEKCLKKKKNFNENKYFGSF